MAAQATTDYAPPRPFHRWASNESMKTVPYAFDRCLTCGTRRNTDEAAGPCPERDDA